MTAKWPEQVSVYMAGLQDTGHVSHGGLRLHLLGGGHPTLGLSGHHMVLVTRPLGLDCELSQGLDLAGHLVGSPRPLSVSCSGLGLCSHVARVSLARGHVSSV